VGVSSRNSKEKKTVPGDGEQNRITLEEVARVRKKQNGDGCFPLSTKKYN